MTYRELAVSPNFKIFPDRKELFIHGQTRQAYPYDSLDTAILVYEDRVKGWFLRYGSMLKEHQDAGFVVLQIAISQIEGMEQYFRGKSSDRKSKSFFASAMKRIFHLDNTCDGWLETFYANCRCGLFHEGATGHSIVIGLEFGSAVEYVEGTVEIQPNMFFDAVEISFLEYVDQLKDKGNLDLRRKFRRFTESRVRRDPGLATFSLRE